MGENHQRYGYGFSHYLSQSSHFSSALLHIDSVYLLSESTVLERVSPFLPFALLIIHRGSEHTALCGPCMHFLLVLFFLFLLAIGMVGGMGGPGVKKSGWEHESVFLYGYGIGKRRQCMINATHRHGLQYIVSQIFIGGVSKGDCRMTFSFYFRLYSIYPIVSMSSLWFE